MNRLVSFLRDFKIIYTAYNFLNRDKLQHNAAPYKKYGIRKFLCSPLSGKDFGHLPQTTPWLDDPEEDKVKKNILSNTSLNNETKEKLLYWQKNGYLILPGFFSKEAADGINKEIDRLLAEKKIRFNERRKIMQAFLVSEKIREAANDKQLLDLLSLVLGRKVFTFQTINFLYGSEQRPHSDSIHMSTYPVGNLAAAWIALEDVNEGNGPLSYYPGSHKLPYPTNEQYSHGGNFFRIGNFANARYEEHVGQQIQKHNLKKEIFHANKGDVLIWHANLLHGGEAIKNKEKTRRSMVVHYFAEDVIKYHELTQRPALIVRK